MEVTKENFKEALEEIKPLLQKADFISFDTELTGLGRSVGHKNHDLDTPQERYEKVSHRVKQFGLIQIGISIFRWCSKSKKFFSATYCFYLSGKLSGSYLFDTSSMIFLAENGFDFNKLFLNGLTFISLMDEAEIRKRRQENLKETDTPTPVKIRDDKAKAFMSSAIHKVKQSIKEDQPCIFTGKELSGFFRKVLFTNVAPRFPTSLFKNVSGPERNIQVLHFQSEAEKSKFLDHTWEEEFSEQMGFTHVVKAILEANKPLVGHNVILDLFHFVEKFISPLPQRLDEFKTIVKSNFPPVYDTKLFAKDPPFSDYALVGCPQFQNPKKVPLEVIRKSANITNTALGNLYDELTLHYSPPEFDVEEGCSSYQITEEGQAHDGGYDAYMTGVCFATMIKKMDGAQWSKKPVMISKHLKNYVNKIVFLGSYDIPFIDLTKEEKIPDRSFIYSVSCPSTWTHMNVRQLFTVLSAYKTVWVNDTHLYVIPQDEDDLANKDKLLEKLRAASGPNIKISFYGSTVGVHNGDRVRLRGAPTPNRPSSLSHKRRSDTQEGEEAGTKSSAEEDSRMTRSLKRLKSVGSDQLSNLTLESPMSAEKILPISSKAESKDVDDHFKAFNESGDW